LCQKHSEGGSGGKKKVQLKAEMLSFNIKKSRKERQIKIKVRRAQTIKSLREALEKSLRLTWDSVVKLGFVGAGGHRLAKDYEH